MAVYVFDPDTGFPKEVTVSGALSTVETDTEFRIVGTSFVWTDDSITGDGSIGNPVRLVNDLASPGDNKIYGTDGTGILGWQDAPTGGVTKRRVFFFSGG